MKMLNRAKSLRSDEYIESDSVKFEFNQMYLYHRPKWIEHSGDHIELKKGKWVECDESTRSIHLSDMIDSEGTKIFASISEDGKGGDIFTADIMHGNYVMDKIQETAMIPFRGWKDSTLDAIKVTGIQE